MMPKEYVKVLEIQFAVLLNRILFSNERGEMMETIVCEKKQYQAIDLAKLVFAVCVVILHCQILDKSNSFEYVIDKVLLRSACHFSLLYQGIFLQRVLEKIQVELL